MGTINSKSKLTFCEGITLGLTETKAKLISRTDDIKAVASKAKYAAMDRVFNVFATLSNEFTDVMTSTNEATKEILEVLVKSTDVGEEFVANAKKGLANAEDFTAPAEFALITGTRDGNEIWDSAAQTSAQESMSKWILTRKEYIEEIATSFKGIEDEQFKDAVKIIGKKNEEFTNSLVSNLARVQEALTELGINLDKNIADIGNTASSLKVGGVSASVNLQGAEV